MDERDAIKVPLDPGQQLIAVVPVRLQSAELRPMREQRPAVPCRKLGQQPLSGLARPVDVNAQEVQRDREPNLFCRSGPVISQK